MSRLRRLAVAALPVLAGTLVLLAGLELGARMLGAPRGLFAGFLPGARGLYPADAEIEVIWGPIPYRASTKSLGFRGPEVPRWRAPGVLRIAAIGDSLTDGFFVDDDATYPQRLDRDLAERGVDAQVIDAARGGGSIDKALAIREDAVLPLAPHVVLLTVVTNDVAQLRGKGPSQIVNAHLSRGGVPVPLWLITRTGLGELAYDVYLRVVSPSYRRRRSRRAGDDRRYEIAGGESFGRNVRIFLERYAETDGLLLERPLRRGTERLVALYAFGLDRFLATCAGRGITAGLVYFPAYPEVYGEARATPLREVLRRAAEEHDVPLLDLTPAFRHEGRDRVLHLAPVDFHPNPAGNAVMAEAVADFVIDAVLPRVRAEGKRG